MRIKWTVLFSLTTMTLALILVLLDANAQAQIMMLGALTLAVVSLHDK